jgi:beta-aspartyl-peptidase (threonine type)
MRTFVPVLVLALLWLGACKSTASDHDVVTPMNASAHVTPEERATGEILAVLRSQSAAWNRGAVDAFMDAGYWHSPDLTFYSQGSITKGYDAVLARYTKRYKSEGAEMGHLEYFQIETEPLGEEVSLARGHWKLTFSGKPALGGLFTLVLKRLPQGWRIVHDHTSVDAP